MLSARRTVVDQLIGRHRSRIENTAGDSVLAEFMSALDSVHCAIEIDIDADPEARLSPFGLAIVRP
jgi:class 3 adenylate cyclase